MSQYRKKSYSHQACEVLLSVVKDKQSLTAALQEPTPRLQQICYGTLRAFEQLNAISQQLLHKALKAKDTDIYLLLLIGIYQLNVMKTPDYAVVSETVNTAKALKKPWATGLLNKLLRRFIAEKDTLVSAANKQLTAKYCHPNWLIKAIKTAYPDQWQVILEVNNSQAPMSCRVNPLKISRDDYLKQLSEQKIQASILSSTTHGIQLKKAIAVDHLPRFFEGFCSIQDEAGQRVTALLDLKPELDILDACAAPGSKTCAILEAQPNIRRLVALDKSALRLKMIEDNRQRLQLSSDILKTIAADAADATEWWDGKKFDRILLDAPCSATGVIRRHPDIKLLRQAGDIAQQCQQQALLLNALWPLLKPNGRLVYSTCSILPEENQLQIQSFLRQHSEAKLHFEEQLLPQQNGHDGFYYAVLMPL